MESIVEFPWMKIAKGELGVHEIPGKAHDERILAYHAVTKLHATTDEIPWWSSFVSYCLEKSGIRSTKSARALSYEHYGREIEEPIHGCIVVMKRGKGLGHVTFYDSKNFDGEIRCLGGNQHDSVCYANYNPDKVVAYVMPTGY
jgi:uncharacterized protein (TIGR02594 family)